MDKQASYKRSERGAALIFAILMILVISVLAATVMFTSQQQAWTALNYRLSAQSRYAAEAGVQSTMNWLANTYTAPTVFTSYDMTKYPVQYNNNPVVLSAMSGVSSNYPTAAVVTAYSAALSSSLTGVTNGSYSTYATLLRMSSSSGGISWLPVSGGSSGVIQTWQITSQGTVSGVRTSVVQVVATYERTPIPGTSPFIDAVSATSTGCKAIDFAGSDYTDSYNSSLGPYGVGNSSSSGGNIQSNGNVYLGGSAVINGTISDTNTVAGACPDGITSSGSYSGTNRLSSNISFPLPWGCSATPCYPSPLPPTSTQNVSTGCAGITGCTSNGTTTIYDNNKSTTVNVFTLAPGDTYGNLVINNADVVHLSAGTYDVNSLDFAKDGQIVIDSGPVVFDVAGQGFAAGSTVINAGGLSGWNLCSGGVTGNPGAYGVATCGASKTAFSGIPANFQIVYAGAAAIASTGAPVSSAIYAPNALVETTGAAVGLYGSVVSASFLEGSKAPVHYDTALAGLTSAGVGQFRPVGGFSWSKF